MRWQRYQLGEYVPFYFTSLNSSGVEAWPSSAPTLTIWDTDKTAIVSARSIPPADYPNMTGFHLFPQPLDSDFSTGIYSARITSTVSAHVTAIEYWFEIVAGGNAKGIYDSLHYYRRPHNDYAVGRTETETLEARKGPKV